MKLPSWVHTILLKLKTVILISKHESQARIWMSQEMMKRLIRNPESLKNQMEAATRVPKEESAKEIKAVLMTHRLKISRAQILERMLQKT